MDLVIQQMSRMRAHEADDGIDDPWHQFYVELDRACFAGAAAEHDSEYPLPVGINGDKRPREEPTPPPGQPAQPRRVRPRRLTPEEERQEAAKQVEQRVSLVDRTPDELLLPMLVYMFVPTALDFPRLSLSIGLSEADLPTVGKKRIHWMQVSHALITFMRLADPNRSERTSYILNSAEFRRLVWRRWLDGRGGGVGAGRCTMGDIPADINDPALDRSPNWYTRGFLGSVVLHRTLLNSARNVVNATATLQLSGARELLDRTVLAPSFQGMDRWMRGEVDWSLRWREHGIQPQPMWHAAWFAPQLSHGLLYLDFVNAQQHTLRGLGKNTQVLSYHPMALRLLNMMRDQAIEAEIPSLVRIPALALGSVLGGGVQITWARDARRGDRIQLRTPRPEGSDPDESPDPLADQPLASVGGLVISGVTASGPFRSPPIGLALPDEPPPPVGLREGEATMEIEEEEEEKEEEEPLELMELFVVEEEDVEMSEAEEELSSIEISITSTATEDRTETSLSSSALSSFERSISEEMEDTDDLFHAEWYRHLMDVWLADLRLDTPDSILSLLRRVGSRKSEAIYTTTAWSQRGFRRRLSNESVPDDMVLLKTGAERRVRGLGGVQDIRANLYKDGKNLLLSRCWMPQPQMRWLRGAIVDPRFYDRARKVWLLDAGQGTNQVRVLQLVRCYNGPALPTVVPDLRMNYLTYAVPVYRQPDDPSQEDLDRIRAHGTLRRFLILPRGSIVLDRVTITGTLLETHKSWAVADPSGIGPASAVHWGTLSLEGLAQTGLVYDWARIAEVEGDETRARRIRRALGAPDEDRSRTDLESAGILFDASQILRQQRFTQATAQWSNLLLDPELPLETLLTSLDAARGFRANRVILTLHPSEMGRGKNVRWNVVQFGPFRPGISDQLTVRMNMTQLPTRKAGTDPRALFNLMAMPAVVRRVQGKRYNTILDFANNSIAADPENSLRMLAARYRTKPRLRIFLAGNPYAQFTRAAAAGLVELRSLEPLFKVLDSNIENAKEKLTNARLRLMLAKERGSYGAIMARTAEVNNAQEDLARMRREREETLGHYRPPRNVNATLGGVQTRVEFRRFGPELNPYGDDWVAAAAQPRAVSVGPAPSPE